MIKANCRDQFTARDFDFIVQTLGKSPKDSVSLADLLTDAETRDTILDHDKLLEAILNRPAQLYISPQFYFYVLTRHVLKRSGLTCRHLADYIASLLETFSRTARMRSPTDEEGAPVQYISDMLLALRNASSAQAFLIRAHVGNYSLFVTGIFHESVERRSRRGAPDVSFYEDIGASSFHVASEHVLARSCDLTKVYHELSSRFHDVRLALNRLSDSLLVFDEPAQFFA